jgi:endonuclease-3
MNTKLRFQKVLGYFQTTQPSPETELQYESSFQLLVAVILSAQCTDKRVNMITPVLFKKYPTAVKMAAATEEEIFSLIRSCSYPNNKAKHLKAMSEMLVAEYNSELPDDVDELQKLPGVGRKTANVIASVVFRKPALAVDTHVHRVAARIGLAIDAKNPLQTEMQLLKHIPPALIPDAHHWLILHGRYICIARKPKCSECGIKKFCAYFQSNP